MERITQRFRLDRHHGLLNDKLAMTLGCDFEFKLSWVQVGDGCTIGKDQLVGVGGVLVDTTRIDPRRVFVRGAGTFMSWIKAWIPEEMVRCCLT